jgi:hypothetical protein
MTLYPSLTVHSLFSSLILAIVQAVIRRLVTPEARIPLQVNPCGVCFGQNGTGTGFPPSRYYDVPMSVSFRQCSILVLTYLLLLPEEQMVETSEPCKRKVFRNSGSTGQRTSFTFQIIKMSM